MRRPDVLDRAGRAARYAAQDLVSFLGRLPRAIGRSLRSFWLGLSLHSRQRLAIGLLGGVLTALVVAFAIPRLPCQFPGGDVCAPADDAEVVVPADALAYVHLTLDPELSQYEDATEALDALPQLTRQAVGRVVAQVPGPGGEPADFARDIAPWLGEQAAVAIVPAGGGAEQVQLLQEGDPEGAADFATSVASGAPQVQDYRGVDLSTDSRGLATASVEGFLAIGTEAGVRQVVDVATDAEDTRPLSEDEVATELRDELPPDRFAEAYLSADGIESLVAEPASPLSSLEPFVDAASSDGAAASVGADDGDLELAVRSSLDPERADANPGFFAAFPGFEPELPERLAKATLGYVGIAEPGTTVQELLAQATSEAPALAQGFLGRLRDLGDVEIEDELLPSLGGEAAFALQPGADEGEAGTFPTEPAVPVLQFVAEGVDSDRARRSLAQLQGQIADALDPGATQQAPVFDRQEAQGVDVQVLRISPTVNLTYAVAGDDLAVATQPTGVVEVIEGEGGLDEVDSFTRATAGFPDEPSLVAYLDLGGLLSLAEREGLAEDPGYALFAAEFRRLAAAGLSVEAESSSLATDARLVIDQDEGEDAAPSPEEGVPAD